jgi:hypothetical protein
MRVLNWSARVRRLLAEVSRSAETSREGVLMRGMLVEADGRRGPSKTSFQL